MSISTGVPKEQGIDRHGLGHPRGAPVLLRRDNARGQSPGTGRVLLEGGSGHRCPLPHRAVRRLRGPRGPSRQGCTTSPLATSRSPDSGAETGRPALSSYAGSRADISAAPASIVLTSFAWRNSWKYQARSYRHWFWDGGVIAANLLATANSAGLRSSVVLGFEDEAVNRLLGLRARQEAAIAICPVGVPDATALPAVVEGPRERAPTPDRPRVPPALPGRGGLPGGLGGARGLLPAGFRRGDGVDAGLEEEKAPGPPYRLIRPKLSAGPRPCPVQTKDPTSHR